MASALMAFVQGLAAEQAQETKAQDVAKDDDLFVDSDQKEAPKTLLDVARAQQEDVRPATSLLAVAQQQQQQQQQAQAQTTKETLAAQVDQEDEQHRREAVHKTLEAVAKEVRDERQQETSQAVAAALKEAAAEQYAADEFEAEEDGERVLAAAKSLVQQKQQQSEEEHEYDEDDDHHDAPAKPKAAIRKKKPAQKQPKSAPRTIRGQLSVFQCRQLTLTQRRLLLATLADDGDASGKQKKARAVNMEAINELAKHRRQQQPVGRRAKAEFAKLDDNRHCRFRPRLKAGGGSRENQPSRSDDEDNGGGGGRSEDFVRRMEAAERARAEGLRRTREEKLYLARVKKVRPTRWNGWNVRSWRALGLTLWTRTGVPGVRQRAVVRRAVAEAQEVPQLRRRVPEPHRLGTSPCALSCMVRSPHSVADLS